MKKALFLIITCLLFLPSCDNDVDMDSKLYGIWVPDDTKTGGLIYKLNTDNTGYVYYIRQIMEDGSYVCDKCMTQKLVNLSLEKINGRYQLSMHLEDGGSFNHFYDYVTDSELKFTLGQFCKKNNGAIIIEQELSCK